MRHSRAACNMLAMNLHGLSNIGLAHVLPVNAHCARCAAAIAAEQARRVAIMMTRAYGGERHACGEMVAFGGAMLHECRW